MDDANTLKHRITIDLEVFDDEDLEAVANRISDLIEYRVLDRVEGVCCYEIDSGFEY